MEEGLKFLAKTLGKVFSDLLETQIEEAENLVSLLGGLPLALEEAAAFIDYENTMRVYGSRPEFYLKDYIELHNKETKRVLTTSKRRHRDNDTPVYITWNITYTKIRAHPGGNLALKLLNYMSYLASEQIPKKLIFHIIQERYEVTESALSLLGKYALMKTDALHFSVHRLVQQVTREHCHDNDEEDEIILYMIERIKLFIDNEPLEAMKDDFIGNVVAFSGYLKRTYQSTVGEKATHFLTSIAIGLHSRGKYASALKIYQQLLEVITSQSEEQQYLQQHKQLFTLELLNSIGVIYHEMGEPMKAVQTHKDLVSKRTELLGPNHPDTLVSLNNLAAVLRDQGNLTEAISIHQQVAAQNSASMNPNHPNYLATRNNLAAVLRHQGKVQEAYEIMEEVQAQRHLSLGPEHPDSLSASHNIANILFDMGQKRKALDILKDVAEKRERVCGASHPDTLKSKMNVATILEDIGSYEEAHEAHVIVLEGMTAMLGEEHPHILVALGNIALNLERRRLYPEALTTYERILGKQRKLLGNVHRSTLTTLNNVAILYRVMDRLEESLAIHREILEARITNLTEFHPDTLSTKNNIALVLAKLGRLDEAFKIHCEVAENRANLLGEDHADTLGSIVSKANILEEQGKFEASLILHEKVFAARLRKLGSTHPETIKSQNTVEYLSDELAKMNAGNKMTNRGGAGEKKMNVEADTKFGAYHPDSKSKGGIWVCLCCGRSKVDEDGPSGFQPAAPKKVHERVMADEGDVLTLLPSQRNLHLNEANEAPAVTNTGESQDADALFTKSQELKNRNKLTEALALVEQVIELRKLQLGPRHPDTSAAIEEFTNIMDEQYRAEVKRSK